MIKLNMFNDEIVIEMFAYLPLVYLDNWAFNVLSLDKKLSRKFKDLMLNKNGTLMISWVTLFEACKKQDDYQFQELLNMVKDIDFNFIDINPKHVIEKENNKKISGKLIHISPMFDLNLTKSYVLEHNSIMHFSLEKAYLNLRENPRFSKLINQSFYFEKDMNPIIEKAKKDSSALLKAKNRYRDRKKIRKINHSATRYLWEQCLDYIPINKNMRMENKGWLDVCHTIVPVAYCNFILLDRRWFNFVKHSGFSYPQIAKAYKRENLENFLSDLNYFKR